MIVDETGREWPEPGDLDVIYPVPHPEPEWLEGHAVTECRLGAIQRRAIDGRITPEDHTTALDCLVKLQVTGAPESWISYARGVLALTEAPAVPMKRAA